MIDIINILIITILITINYVNSVPRMGIDGLINLLIINFNLMVNNER